MKKWSVMLMALALPLLATACNTVRGMGEDIQAGGQAIDSAATKVQSR